MSFPSSPTNGQIAVVANISYIYASATNSWKRYSGAYTGTSLILTDTTPSNGNFTGALQVYGGMNVQGASYLGNVFSNGQLLSSVVTALGPGTFTISNTTSSTSTTTGALVINGGLGIGGTVNIGGMLTTQLSSDVISIITNASAVSTHNLNQSAVFFHVTPVSNFTVNATNVPTTTNRATVMSLLIQQTGTAYVPTAFQVDGVPQTLRWLSGSTATGHSTSTDVVSFSLIRQSGTWTVLAQSSYFS